MAWIVYFFEPAGNELQDSYHTIDMWKDIFLDLRPVCLVDHCRRINIGAMCHANYKLQAHMQIGLLSLQVAHSTENGNGSARLVSV